MGINIQITNGLLGGVLAGVDTQSGMVLTTAAYPIGVTAGNPIITGSSYQDFYNAGIVDDASDETRSTATLVFSATASSGSTIQFVIGSPYNSIAVPTYTFGSTMSASAAKTAYASFLSTNNAIYTAGFGITSGTNSVTLSAPVGQGAVMNGKSITQFGTYTLAGSTSATFSGGVDSTQAAAAWHIQRYFEQSPNSTLYVYVRLNSNGTTDFSEITTLQNLSEGNIKQFGYDLSYLVMNPDLSDFASLKVVLNGLETDKQGAPVIVGVNLTGQTMANQPNYAALAARGITIVTSSPDAGEGSTIETRYSKILPVFSTLLGKVSSTNVGTSPAWVAQGDVSGNITKFKFTTGEKYLALVSGLSTMDSKNIVYLRKYPGLAGAYFNQSFNCAPLSDDYSSIERYKAITKVISLLNTVLTPAINSPVLIDDTTGKLFTSVVAYFEQICQAQLNGMSAANQISGGSVFVDPAQDVLATNTINVKVSVVPIGKASTINVTVGFAVKI